MQQVFALGLAAIAVLVGLVALASIALLAAGSIARARLRRDHSPVGRLVEVAGTQHHVVRRGPDTGPTVVLVAGVGGVAASWAGIQERLAPDLASLAYDRAGLGWSGPAHGPRTAAAMADELHELLAASGDAGPYVVVGHSLGGIVARQLAHRHPADIAGLVLVDSAHEEQYTRLPEVARAFRRMAAMPGPLVRLMASLVAIRAGRAALDPRLPHEAAEALRASTALSASHLPTAMAEMRAVALDAEPVASLGDLPLEVLRHGRFERMPMLDEAVNERFEALFADLQGELAALSTRGRVVVAEDAGHDIHLDRPDLVLDAIRSVLAAARGPVATLEPGGPRALGVDLAVVPAGITRR